MSPEVHRQGDRILLELEGFEAELLGSLPAALRSLLDDPDRSDPAVARLFPVIVPEDATIDREVRDLIHDDVLRERLDALDEVAEILARGRPRRGGGVEVELVEDEPGLLLGVLNDIRLTLGARVGVEHLDRDEIDERHPAAQTLALMDHLAWIQEQLIAVIDPVSVSGEDDAERGP